MLGDLLPALIAIGTIIAGILGLRWKWRGDGAREQREKAAKAAADQYNKIRKAMDDAENSFGDDPAAARRWLSERERNVR